MSLDNKTLNNNRYKLLKKIGEGGMAEVYEGRDLLLERQVAIKVLSSKLAADASFATRFKREAQSAAALSHTNIVGVHDYGEDDNIRFIVMELMHGQTLTDYLIANNKLDVDTAIELSVGIARGLAAAHKSGTVHRDVKPGNIMLTLDGVPKVVDFGIARAFDDSQTMLTQVGSVVGTASYFSPEQAHGQKVDHRSDLYSLGVVMHQMLNGVPPFVADSPVALAMKHSQEQAPPANVHNNAVSGELVAIISRLLEKKPENRYQSADALVVDLLNYKNSGSGSVDQLAAGSGGSGFSPSSVAEPASSPTNPATPISPDVPVSQTNWVQPGWQPNSQVNQPVSSSQPQTVWNNQPQQTGSQPRPKSGSGVKVAAIAFGVAIAAAAAIVVIVSNQNSSSSGALTAGQTVTTTEQFNSVADFTTTEFTTTTGFQFSESTLSVEPPGVTLSPQDRAEFITELSDELHLDTSFGYPLGRNEANCLARKMIDEIGVDRMSALSPESGGEPTDRELAIILSCVDLRGELVNSLVADGVPQDQAQCFTDNLSDEALIRVGREGESGVMSAETEADFLRAELACT